MRRSVSCAYVEAVKHKWSYSKSKLELKSNFDEILSAIYKFKLIRDSILT